MSHRVFQLPSTPFSRGTGSPDPETRLRDKRGTGSVPRMHALVWSALAIALPVVPIGATPDALRVDAGALPVDQAFAFSSRLRGDRLVARWEMPPGYYLYRHRFSVIAGAGVALGEPEIPDGEPKVDDHHGQSQVHYGKVEITVPVLSHGGVVTARFAYQGCAEGKLCYAPRQRSVTHVPGATTDAGPARAGADKTRAPRAPERAAETPARRGT